MSEQNVIPEFRVGDRTLKADHLNQLVAAARRSLSAVPPMRVVHTADSTTISIDTAELGDWWVGRVAGSDEIGHDDFTDARYYVLRQNIANSDANVSDVLRWKDVTGWASDIVAVTNLAEVVAGTHLLDSDTIVVVHEREDSSLPPLWRRTMEAHSAVSEVVLTDLRISDIKIQKRTSKIFVLATSDMGWQDSLQGSDCI